MVPLWLVLATDNAHAVRVFAYLGAKHADRETYEAFPSHRSIAAALKTSTATVERALMELKRVGAMVITAQFGERGQTSNLYRLITAKPVEEPTEKRKKASRVMSPLLTGDDGGLSADDDAPLLTGDEPPASPVPNEPDRDSTSHSSLTSNQEESTSRAPREPVEFHPTTSPVWPDETEDGDEMSFASLYVLAYRKATGREHPGAGLVADCIALERDFTREACVQLAQDLNWEKHPNWMRPKLMQRRREAAVVTETPPQTRTSLRYSS